MGSSRNRTSRALLVVLAGVVVLGAIAYAYNWNKTRSASASNAMRSPPFTTVAASSSAPAVASGQAPVVPASAPVVRPPAIVSAAFAQVLSDAQAKAAAGKLADARDALNGPLVNGQLTPDDAGAARAELSKINQRLVFSTDRFAADPLQSTYVVQSGDQLTRIALRNSVPWEFVARINGLADPRRLRMGQTVKLVKGPFHAVVSKSAFRLDVYLGSPGEAGATYIMSLPVGLGKDDSTPTGKWLIEPGKKLKNPAYFSPRGEGVYSADDPKNPLGEYWLALQGMEGQAMGKMSYGIHGTIDPDSIGKQASMGCIRLRNEDVALLYEMLADGKSTVVVKE